MSDDALSKAERYREAANRYGELAKQAEPGEQNRNRGERLQIMLGAAELALVDDFRFKKRMPSRASALRELLKRGLAE
jgi:hypothetical protein